MARDQIIENNVMRAIQLAHRRKLTLMATIFSVVVLLIAFIVVHEVHMSKQKSLGMQYASIDKVYNVENADYMQKIEAQKAQMDPKNPAANSLPNIKPNYDTSMGQFRDFALKYPSEPYGWQAAIRSGTYFIANNKIDDAQKVLEAVLPYTSGENLIQIKIRTALAGIYASQNNMPKAIEFLNIAEKLPHNPLVMQTQFYKAQLLAGAGQKEEAKKILNQIISQPIGENASPFEQSPNTVIVHQAKILLNQIGL